MTSWNTLSIYNDDATLVNGATISHTDHNTHRTNSRDLSSSIKTEGIATERHHNSASEPDDASDGVIWSDSGNTLLKWRNGSAWENVAIATNANTWTGVNDFPDGSAAAPSITNTGDLDTGLFFPAANAIGLAAFGVEPMRITVTTDLTDAVVAILSTEESTSPTTGALTVGDGLGVAGAAWVGGLLNVAAAVTFQSTLAAQGNITLSNTKDLLCATDGGSDLGSTGTRFGTIFVDAATITNNATVGGTLDVTGASAFSNNITATRDGTNFILALQTFRSTAFQTNIFCRSARGTVASPLVSVTGDRLLTIHVEGMDANGGTSKPSSEIIFRVDGTPGVSDMPGRIEFLVTPAGSASTALALTIKNDKELIVAGALTAQDNITLANTKDLLCATDGGSDIGATATRFGTIFVDTITTTNSITLAAGKDLLGSTTSDIGATGARLQKLWIAAVDLSGAATFGGAVALNDNTTLANTKDLLCATDGGSDIGATATRFGTGYFDDLVVTNQVTAGGNITLDDTFDLLCAVDGGSDIGATATRFGTIFVDTITTTNSITLANTKDLLCATDGGSDIGATATRFGTIFVDTLTTTNSITLANTKDLLCATDGGSDIGATATRFGTGFFDALETKPGDADIANVGGVLFTDHTTVGNVGAGEDDLMSYTLPAGTLSSDGDAIRITGRFSGNGVDNTIVRVYLGTTVIDTVLGSGVVIATGFVELLIIRTGATTQILTGHSVKDNASLTLAGTTAETLSGALVVKFTGENQTDTTSNAIRQDYMLIEFIPANA